MDNLNLTIPLYGRDSNVEKTTSERELSDEGTENDQNTLNKSFINCNQLEENQETQTKPSVTSDSTNDDDDENEEVDFQLKTKRKKAIFKDSNSKNEASSSENESNDLKVSVNNYSPVRKFNKISRIIDSDSEDDDHVSNNEKPAEIFTVNEKGDLVVEGENKQNALSNLCDPESSDENEDDISDSELNVLKSNAVVSNKSRRKSGALGNCKGSQKKMTAKQALEERKEILSESQRRLRESRVSLPYHRPKPKTLKEFLQNRPKLASPLMNFAQGQSPSVAIKMSTEQLEIISHKLKEREKQIIEFYKSESESDNEEIEDKVKQNQEDTVGENITTEDLNEKCGDEIDYAMEVDNPDEEQAKEDENRTSNEENSVEITGTSIEKTPEENANKLVIVSDIILKPGCENVNNELPQSSSNDIQKDKNDFHNLDDEIEEVQLDKKEDEYEFNLDDLDEDMDQQRNVQLNKINKKELIEKLASVQPRLSGGPNQLIELSDDNPVSDEISKLRKRFMKHIAKADRYKNKELSVTTVNNGEIIKETFSLTPEENEESVVPLEKPGVRLQKLREELRSQIAQKRSELWKEKKDLTLKNEENNSDANKDKDGDYEMDILDYDEEEEGDLTETDEEDDENLEENDCDMSEKKKKRSEFIEEEAEVSDEDNDELNDENKVEEADDEENEDESEVAGSNDKLEEKVEQKRILRRIIKPLDSDEDDEELENEVKKKAYALEYEKPNKEPENLTEDENSPPLQPMNSNVKKLFETPSKPELDFSTPVTYMTGLNNLNKSSEKKKYTTLDQSENVKYPEDNLVSTQDLLEICSGKFPDTCNTLVSSPEITTQELKDDNADFSTQDLTEICSGKFVAGKSSEDKNTHLNESEENIISQLIDEEELKKFRKKFESPLNADRRKIIDFDEAEEVQGGGILDSDGDDDGELKLKKKSSNKKKLVFTDDEDSSDEPEETINLQDDNLSDIEYDSEENEIDADEEKLREIMKANEFLEHEAELSESEWGSEDEDEKNLDDMEFEKGDEEKFDQEELRSDIEKIQMRQMLDEDNREVKLLQELLLEDGELHGSGRQRQFRWKNADADDENEEKKVDDEEIYLEEDESEEQWRKMRHEREIYMLNKQSQDEDDDEDLQLESESFINRTLKIKSQTTIFSEPSKEMAMQIKQPFSLLNKRGSFLSRSEQILKKLAESSKVNMVPKNKNKIVFQAVNVQVEEKKRKSLDAEDFTPKAIKRIRLSGLSPANKPKTKGKKSLFGN